MNLNHFYQIEDEDYELAKRLQEELNTSSPLNEKKAGTKNKKSKDNNEPVRMLSPEDGKLLLIRTFIHPLIPHVPCERLE
jgi:hypothetical protein